jgi:hypothetical protein
MTRPPRVLRSFRLGGAPETKRAWHGRDFELKRQHIELFERFDDFRDGTVVRLDVKDGLPVSMLVEEVSNE